MATTYLDMLPIEIMDIILDKIHRAELKEHKHKSKQLIADLTYANHEKVYCSGCGKNIMGEAMTFYKNDMKTYINIGERCCLHNPNIIKCSKDEATHKDYYLCYESLEKEDIEREIDDDERYYIKVIDENKYSLGYGPILY